MTELHKKTFADEERVPTTEEKKTIFKLGFHIICITKNVKCTSVLSSVSSSYSTVLLVITVWCRFHIPLFSGSHALQGVPINMGIQWRIRYSFFLWISIVNPNFKSHNIFMSARVYFMKTVNDCKDVSLMSPQDEQRRRTNLLCLCIL